MLAALRRVAADSFTTDMMTSRTAEADDLVAALGRARRSVLTNAGACPRRPKHRPSHYS
jgi:hypothetical protein